MIGHDQRVYIWRKRDEGWRPDLVQLRTSQFGVVLAGMVLVHLQQNIKKYLMNICGRR